MNSSSTTMSTPPVTADGASTVAPHPALFQAILFLLAFVQFSVGPNVPPIASAFGVAETDLGIAFTLQFSGALLMLLVGGRLVRVFGYRANLIGSTLLFLVAITAVPFTTNVAQLCAVLFFLGAGSAHAQVVIYAMVELLYTGQSVRFQAIVSATFAMGAVLGPFYTSVTQQSLGWIAVFWTGTALLLPIMIWLSRAPMQVPVAAKSDTAEGRALGWFAVLTTVLVLYVGGEAVVNAWVSTFFKDALNASPFWQGLSLSVFWTGMVAGRLLVGAVGSRWRPQRFIYIGSGGSAVFMAAGALSPSPLSGIVCFALAGVFMGGVFAPVVSLLGAQPGGTSRMHLFFALAQIGPVVMPFAAGRIADAVGFRTAMLLPVPVFVALIVMVVIFTAMVSGRGSSGEAVTP